MLAIRLQRTGRKGHAQFRMVVQDSRFSPTSGRVVAQLGSYNPHTKVANIDKEAAQKFLNNGAQPSDRVVRLLKSEGVKLPKWVKEPVQKKRSVRNPEKLQKEAPMAEATQAESSEEPATTPQETTADSVAENPASAEEKPADETETQEVEVPAEEPSEDPQAEEVPSTEGS